jgi:hypothetical protein
MGQRNQAGDCLLLFYPVLLRAGWHLVPAGQGAELCSDQLVVGVPPIWLGLAQALGSGISILGARYAYRLESLGAKASLLLVTALPGVLYLLMAVVMHPVFSVVAFCALYGSMSLKGPIFSGHLNRHIESKNRATVLSLISMFSGLYVALVGLVIGRIGDFSVTYAFVFMGAVVLIGSLLFRVKRNADDRD